MKIWAAAQFVAGEVKSVGTQRHLIWLLSFNLKLEHPTIPTCFELFNQAFYGAFVSNDYYIPYVCELQHRDLADKPNQKDNDQVFAACVWSARRANSSHSFCVWSLIHILNFYLKEYRKKKLCLEGKLPAETRVKLVVSLVTHLVSTRKIKKLCLKHLRLQLKMNMWQAFHSWRNCVVSAQTTVQQVPGLFEHAGWVDYNIYQFHHGSIVVPGSLKLASILLYLVWNVYYIKPHNIFCI